MFFLQGTDVKVVWNWVPNSKQRRNTESHCCRWLEQYKIQNMISSSKFHIDILHFVRLSWIFGSALTIRSNQKKKLIKKISFTMFSMMLPETLFYASNCSTKNFLKNWIKIFLKNHLTKDDLAGLKQSMFILRTENRKIINTGNCLHLLQ